MANILNTRGSSYYFIFPRGFFPEEVTDKYSDYIKSQPVPYDTVPDFLNSTIQSVTLPSLSMETVEQVRQFGKRIAYKSSIPVQDLFNKEFSITFRVVDGFINYWIFLETVLYYMNFKNTQVFVQNLPLRVLDSEGNVTVSVIFSEVLITNFSELQMDYTNYSPADNTFTIGFKSNYIDIDMNVGTERH